VRGGGRSGAKRNEVAVGANARDIEIKMMRSINAE
jgi:hypothetical protein